MIKKIIFAVSFLFNRENIYLETNTQSFLSTKKSGLQYKYCANP